MTAGTVVGRHAMLLAVVLGCGLAGGGPVEAQEAKSRIELDLSKLPALPTPELREERSRAVLMASGAGAVMGILAADLVTGGILLAPLGVPSVAAWFNAVAALPPPTYSLAQRALAGVATLAAGVGGGYLGVIAVRQQNGTVARR